MVQVFRVLLWKIYIVRKRRWIVTLCELFIPILLFWFLVYFTKLSTIQTEKIIYDAKLHNYTNIVSNQSYKLAYTPPDNATYQIMVAVLAKLKSHDIQVTLMPQETEEGLVQWLRHEYLSESNYWSNLYSYTNHSAGVGVIFSTYNVSSLKYTLRTTKGSMQTEEATLYGDKTGYSFFYYHDSGFLTIQAAIDQAYLFSYHSVNIPDNILVDYLPYADFISFKIMTYLLPSVMSLAFNFMMPSLLKCIIEEKSSGIKEMTKILGLKPWVIWLNWLVYSLVVAIPVSLVVTAFLTTDTGAGRPVNVDHFTFWILFLLFIVAYTSLIFCFSTFFTNGTLAIIIGFILWYIGTISLNVIFVTSPSKHGLFLNTLSCLWPSIALQWSIDIINDFQKSGYQWTMSNLFDGGSGEGRVSVGLAVIMLVVDMILYNLIAWYVENINPGPYGRAKPPGFIFQCFSKKNKYESKSIYQQARFHENYEKPPSDSRVGIHIENLRKTFNQGKVVAVEKVDLDIYEGNITALLGHNGAGKTTIMSILAGFFSPTKGKVIVKDKNIFDNIEEFRSGLGLCPQHNLLFSFFSVIEHLIFFGMLKGLTRKKSEEEGLRLLNTLNEADKKDMLTSKLCEGMKRKLCLSIALIGNPEVLLLDEPTSGLDPEARRQVWDLLLGFRGHRTIIITTHFMEEADVLGDRIAIMDHGQVSCYGTSMFLKKLYNTGYHLSIFKTERAPVPPITSMVKQHVNTSRVRVVSQEHLVYVINLDESTNFPVLFAALDSSVADLGLTGMSIICSTLEDVFLKVAKSPDRNAVEYEVLDDEMFAGQQKRVTGSELIFQQMKGLLIKRFLTKKKNH